MSKIMLIIIITGLCIKIVIIKVSLLVAEKRLYSSWT